MIIINGFVWLLVTYKAREVMQSGLFDVFALYDDGSESLCVNQQDITSALDAGLDLAVEVGHLTVEK